MEVFDVDDYTAHIDDFEAKIYLAVYDIVENRARYRLAKLFSKYGFRIQKSAFEIICTKEAERDIIRNIEKIIDEKNDLVRLYRLCGNDRIYSFGNAEKTFEEDVVIL